MFLGRCCRIHIFNDCSWGARKCRGMDGVNYIVYILFSMKNEYQIPPTGHLIKIIYKRVWFTRERTKPVDTINNNNKFNMSRLM